MDELIKYIETSLKYRLGLLTEAPEDEGAADAGSDAGGDAEADAGGADEGGDAGGEDLFSQDDVDAASKGMGGETGGDGGGDAAGEETPPEGQETGAEGAGATQSDQAKIQELFTDSGDPKVDYALTADANIRLARFKFKYAGIDPMSLMSDDEKRVGVRADELESRLTPDQYQLYMQKNKELREEFPQIAERERRVIIYNSNIPIFYNDENGVPRVISHKKDLTSAIDKIEKFMNKSFGEDWADNKKAVKFLLSIKINFSEEKKIRPNLIPTSYFQPQGERGIIAFNKLYAEIPPSIDKFIKDNIESEEYKKSPLFRTFINDYTGEQGEGSSRISVYPVIMDPDAAAEEEAGAEGDAGAEGGDEGGDAGAEGDAGADAAAEGGDAGGEEMDLGDGL
jgi:hypothetical protein